MFGIDIADPWFLISVFVSIASLAGGTWHGCRSCENVEVLEWAMRLGFNSSGLGVASGTLLLAAKTIVERGADGKSPICYCGNQATVPDSMIVAFVLGAYAALFLALRSYRDKWRELVKNPPQRPS